MSLFSFKKLSIYFADSSISRLISSNSSVFLRTLSKFFASARSSPVSVLRSISTYKRVIYLNSTNQSVNPPPSLKNYYHSNNSTKSRIQINFSTLISLSTNSFHLILYFAMHFILIFLIVIRKSGMINPIQILQIFNLYLLNDRSIIVFSLFPNAA